MRAIICDKKEIAKGTLMFELEVLGEKIHFKPGQFLMLELPHPHYTDDKGNVRMFSIVNSPSEQGVVTIATRLSDSAFKRSLQELTTGSEAYVDNIGGLFTLPNDTKTPLVFIAGGIGITPFMSMLRYIAEEKLGYKIIMIYSNKDLASTAFYDELRAMDKKSKNLKVIFSMTDDPEWQGESRKIDTQMIKDLVPEPHSRTYMVSGPPGMVQATLKALKAIGADDENIMTDSFVGY